MVARRPPGPSYPRPRADASLTASVRACCRDDSSDLSRPRRIVHSRFGDGPGWAVGKSRVTPPEATLTAPVRPANHRGHHRVSQPDEPATAVEGAFTPNPDLLRRKGRHPRSRVSPLVRSGSGPPPRYRLPRTRHSQRAATVDAANRGVHRLPRDWRGACQRRRSSGTRATLAGRRRVVVVCDCGLDCRCCS